VTTRIRIPAELVSRLDALVPRVHADRSDVQRRAVELSLHRLGSEADAARYELVPVSDEELALADDPAAWRGRPAW
jgi:hypothetical protein